MLDLQLDEAALDVVDVHAFVGAATMPDANRRILAADPRMTY